jgi:hypothetical protein
MAPWRRKPKRVYEILAQLDTGTEVLAARFNARTRANAFVSEALSRYIYQLNTGQPRYTNSPMVDWGDPRDPLVIIGTVDEPL